MKISEIRALLADENARAKPSDIEMYAQQFHSYLEAAENIQQNGTIVSHPRTGQPMENPYVKIRTGAELNLKKFGRLNTNKLWQKATDHLESLQNGQ
jgi:phage terminase small subunit